LRWPVALAASMSLACAGSTASSTSSGASSGTSAGAGSSGSSTSASSGASAASSSGTSRGATSSASAGSSSGSSSTGTSTGTGTSTSGTTGTSGPLTITVALALDASQVSAGQTVHAQVTYVNPTSSPVQLDQVVIAGRPPGGTHASGPYDDFAPSLSNQTLQPGATLVVSGARTFTGSDPVGAWESYPTYHVAGAASYQDGPSVHFTVGPAATSSSSSTSTSTSSSSSGTSTAGDGWLTGVNLAGAQFGETHLPGTFGTDYTYPTSAETAHFVGLGMNAVRLGFLWERLQHGLQGPLDATELGRLDAYVDDATQQGAHVIIEIHNYARYNGQVVGQAGSSVTAADLADFWGKVAAHYQANPRVIFGLMNEPHDMDTTLWLNDANAAIQAIRTAGATQLILVPGNAYTGAWTWSDTWYGTPNATVMGGVVDPGNHFAIEVHQYLDSDGSGTSASCVSATVGSQRLAGFTQWLVANHLQGYLGEFGSGTDATCLAALDDMLGYMDLHRDVWLGWTAWAAGPWWGPSYILTLEPDAQGHDQPQLAPMLNHVH
jgi:endoglucanase